jgi:hypothetical protein
VRPVVERAAAATRSLDRTRYPIPDPTPAVDPVLVAILVLALPVSASGGAVAAAACSDVRRRAGHTERFVPVSFAATAGHSIRRPR